MGFHTIKSPVARKIIAGTGVVASLVVLGVSGTLNFRYGYTLGASEVEKVGIGLAAVSADVFMAISLFFAFAAWKNRDYTKALAATVLWLSMTGICAWSAVSQISFNRLEATGQRQVASINFDDVRKELADARAELKFIPEHRPEATVRSDILAHKTSRYWSLTNECDEGSISGTKQREYCSAYQKMNGELGNALAATAKRSRIAALIAKSEEQTAHAGAQVVGEADAGATTWANLTGLSVRTTQSIGAAMFAFMLLIGTGVGLWVSVGTLREPEEEAPVVPLEPVADSALAAPSVTVLSPVALSPPPRMLSVVAPSRQQRPEPLPEARQMLDAIGFPVAPIRGEQREKDAREHVGWRFLAWLAAYNLVGNFPHQQIDELYAEFATADHRQPWGMRIVKSELGAIRYCTTSTPDGQVQWNIAPPSIPRLLELLVKRGVATFPSPTPPPSPPKGDDPSTPRKGGGGGASIIPLASAASGANSEAAEKSGDSGAKAIAAQKRVAYVGWHKLLPDWSGMTALAREQKRAFQSRLARDRKQGNRMRRARVA